MLRLKQFTFNPFQENTYLLSDESSEAVIIDPGCISEYEYEQLYAEIADAGLKPVAIINTHCHVDHVLGNKRIKDYYGIPLFIHKEDLFILNSVSTYAPGYGIHDYEEIQPDDFIEDGKNFNLEILNWRFSMYPGILRGMLHFTIPNQGFALLVMCYLMGVSAGLICQGVILIPLYKV